VQELFSSIFANRVVVLYAASGAGKTSLLNAGVVPLLEEQEHFEVLPTVRLHRFAPEELEARSVENVFVYTTLLNWTGESLADATLATFLASLPREHDARGRPVPRAVVLDQFEELFTVYPEHWEHREGFFEQLAEALEADPHLRLVLALREDYLAQLDPLLPLLPFYVPFRLEQLGREAAVEAVTGPVEKAGRRFAPGVAERLVDDLLTLRVDVGTGRPIEARGEYVEPVQLQVTCQSLWAELPADAEEITAEHLHAFGDVDEVLRRFYDEVVRAAAVAGRVREGRLRHSIEAGFITSVGTRSTLYRTAETTGEIPNAAIEELEDRHLVRAEWRAGARWYELTHDRLIEPVETANARYRSRVSRRRRKRAITGGGVLVLLGALGAGFVTLRPHPPSATISIASITPNVAYQSAFGRKVTFPRIRAADRGSRLSIQVTTHRLRGEILVLEAEVVDAVRGDPLAPPQFVAAMNPQASYETVPVPAWLPIPRKATKFFYRLTLSDTKRLARTDSKPFATSSSDGHPAVALGTSSRLEVVRSGDGAGIVVSSPAGIDCGTSCLAEFSRGTSVTLNALPGAGSRFAGWRGTGCRGAGACVVAMIRRVSAVADFARVPIKHVLGKSVKGREIRAVEIGNPRAKLKVLVVGCVHGDECNGIAIAKRLAQASPVVGTDLWIVPNLNPDGLVLHTRRNAHGVDLNRNFPWRWDSATGTQPGSQEYRGPRPLSEPESMIAYDLIKRLKPAVTVWYYARKGPYPPPAVGEAGGRIPVARVYERLVKLGHVPGDNPGSAPNWQNATVPNTVAFFVELPFEPLTRAEVSRHANAVRALASG
jgi:Zinc carboxypeptidase